MTASDEANIREYLRRFLGGEVSLGDFEDWFVVHSWNVHQMGDPSLADLVYEIELRLAEYTNGHRTEDELRRVLVPTLNTMHASVGEVPARTGSTSTTVSIPIQWSPVTAGRLSAAVLV